MQFNAFPGPELVNQKGLLRRQGKKCSQELYALHKYVSKIRVKYTLPLIKKIKRFSPLKKNILCVNYRTLNVKQQNVASGARRQTKPPLSHDSKMKKKNGLKNITYNKPSVTCKMAKKKNHSEQQLRKTHKREKLFLYRRKTFLKNL